MTLPDYKLPLFLHTDACKNGFAEVLTQIQEGKRVIVDATSRTTSPAEKNYGSTKLECACVIWAVKKWKYHLYAARHTTIITDSRGLQYLQQKSSQLALVERWLCELEEFSYSVEYHKGEENIVDFLSRQDDYAAAVSTRSSRVVTDEEVKQALRGRRRHREREEEEKPSKQPSTKRNEMEKRKRSQTPAPSMSLFSPRRQDDERRTSQRRKHTKNMAISRGQAIPSPTYQEIQDAENLSQLCDFIVKEVPFATGEIRKRIVVPLHLQQRVVEDIHKLSHAGVFGTLAMLQQRH